jgi:hypothetical protein
MAPESPTLEQSPEQPLNRLPGASRVNSPEPTEQPISRDAIGTLEPLPPSTKPSLDPITEEVITVFDLLEQGSTPIDIMGETGLHQKRVYAYMTQYNNFKDAYHKPLTELSITRRVLS